MTKRFTEDGREDAPQSRQGGSYPPDIARRRRQLGLPVTPAEHVRYEAGELSAPPVTSAQMAATLERWGPQCNPLLRHVLETIAARCRAREREPGEEG